MELNVDSKFLCNSVAMELNVDAKFLGNCKRAAFGKKCKDQEEFLSAFNETGKLLGGFNIEDLFPSINTLLRWVSGIRSRLEKLHRVTDRILENIINEHNNEGKTTTSDVGKSNNDEENHEDLVDVLLKVQQDGDIILTIDNIKAVIWEAISKVIEIGEALEFDFKGKKVGMAEVFAEVKRKFKLGRIYEEKD
ncbi:hypothetical protein LWI28_018393 [Acer negundo]|uniref:Uncharacterized protein n=1 Tax=Acer negundo TaxID=4023 RepID=A0AAD5JA60_ACENE|nr:hypothetical protein LWI28_018393 [Acer negundo]